MTNKNSEIDATVTVDTNIMGVAELDIKISVLNNNISNPSESKFFRAYVCGNESIANSMGNAIKEVRFTRTATTNLEPIDVSALPVITGSIHNDCNLYTFKWYTDPGCTNLWIEDSKFKYGTLETLSLRTELPPVTTQTPRIVSS